MKYLDYFGNLYQLMRSVEVNKGTIDLKDGLDGFRWMAKTAHERGNKTIFIGNGGSAATCSHMAIDYSKNGHMRAIALNDASALTCLGNDHGYERVFADQLEANAREGDVLVALSASGRSPNILAAVSQIVGCQTVTFSGFTADNPLREMGRINFYVDSQQYGPVEIVHLTLLHAALDFHIAAGGTEC